jgi:hypothetical protein
LLFSISALAQGKGNTAQGKPFVELEGMIVEVEGEVASLQDQVDSLVGRVDSVEEEQIALQTAITDLQTQNASFEAQIAANAADIASIEGQIGALVDENAALQAQIDQNSGDVAAAQDQIDANEALITSLALTLDTLQGNLQQQIDNNLALIGVMENRIAANAADLERKQNVINGSCPDGSAIVEVLPDGGVVCGSSGGGGSGVEISTIVKTTTVGAGLDKGVAQACPGGDIAVAVGFYAPEGVLVRSAHPYYILNRWWGFMNVTNTNAKTETVDLYVSCMGLETAP